MLTFSIKQFIKPTFPKIATTVILIGIFILGRRLVAQTAIPAENLFSKIDLFIFKPAEFFSKLFSNPDFYYLHDFVYFFVNFIEYYLIASLLIFIFKNLKSIKYYKNTK